MDSWTKPTEIQTRDAVRSSLGGRMIFVSIVSQIVSLVSTMIWGYTPFPTFGLTGLITSCLNEVCNGGGKNRSDEESLKEPVNVDVRQPQEKV